MTVGPLAAERKGHRLVPGLAGGHAEQLLHGGAPALAALSGTGLTMPAARSVMFSWTTSDTVAVVGVKDTPGVTVTSGSGRTDGNGHLVVPLNSYDLNTVTLDAGSLPLDTELSNTSRQVILSGQAVGVDAL